jgi:hypothetical protein
MLPTIRGPLGYFLQPLDIVPVDCKPGYPGLLTWDHPSSDLLFCDFGCSIVSFLALHGCRFKVATPTAFLAQHISTCMSSKTPSQRLNIIRCGEFCWLRVASRQTLQTFLREERKP